MIDISGALLLTASLVIGGVLGFVASDGLVQPSDANNNKRFTIIIAAVAVAVFLGDSLYAVSPERRHWREVTAALEQGGTFMFTGPQQDTPTEQNLNESKK
ncbi:MAG: hypothetical protein O2910_02770 [Proteobacteria bacterium]|nr:hypothetical protein [Pseudomonadota bacterium]